MGITDLTLRPRFFFTSLVSFFSFSGLVIGRGNDRRWSDEMGGRIKVGSVCVQVWASASMAR